VVSAGMDVVGSRVFRAVTSPERPGPTCEGAVRMEVGVNHDTRGPHHPRHLPEKAQKVAYVTDHEAGHHQIEAPVGKGQSPRVAQGNARDQAASPREHRGRDVEADQEARSLGPKKT
jgi:hypothetical protein